MVVTKWLSIGIGLSGVLFSGLAGWYFYPSERDASSLAKLAHSTPTGITASEERSILVAKEGERLPESPAFELSERSDSLTRDFQDEFEDAEQGGSLRPSLIEHSSQAIQGVAPTSLDLELELNRAFNRAVAAEDYELASSIDQQLVEFERQQNRQAGESELSQSTAAEKEPQPEQPITEQDCAPPAPPGSFRCPCPLDNDWRPNWRDFYNPEHVARFNCRF